METVQGEAKDMDRARRVQEVVDHPEEILLGKQVLNEMIYNLR
jgi:hypothetical protein